MIPTASFNNIKLKHKTSISSAANAASANAAAPSTRQRLFPATTSGPLPCIFSSPGQKSFRSRGNEMLSILAVEWVLYGSLRASVSSSTRYPVRTPCVGTSEEPRRGEGATSSTIDGGRRDALGRQRCCRRHLHEVGGRRPLPPPPLPCAALHQTSAARAASAPLFWPSATSCLRCRLITM
eukprot:COSAG06_NODE_7384_length_2522_cov_2.123813_1_plen_180_part_10